MSILLAATVLVAPAPTATSVSVGPTDRVDAARGAGVKQQVIDLTNAERDKRGCSALRANASLGEAAQKHSKKMANYSDDHGWREALQHQLPGEAGLGTRITRAGYRNWTLVGENIASGYPTAEAVVRGWMASQGHRRNILNCRFKHIGIGLAYDNDNLPFWTQDFGRR